MTQQEFTDLVKKLRAGGEPSGEEREKIRSVITARLPALSRGYNLRLDNVQISRLDADPDALLTAFIEWLKSQFQFVDPDSSLSVFFSIFFHEFALYHCKVRSFSLYELIEVVSAKSRFIETATIVCAKWLDSLFSACEHSTGAPKLRDFIVEKLRTALWAADFSTRGSVQELCELFSSVLSSVLDQCVKDLQNEETVRKLFRTQDAAKLSAYFALAKDLASRISSIVEVAAPNEKGDATNEKDDTTNEKDAAPNDKDAAPNKFQNLVASLFESQPVSKDDSLKAAGRLNSSLAELAAKWCERAVKYTPEQLADINVAMQEWLYAFSRDFAAKCGKDDPDSAFLEILHSLHNFSPAYFVDDFSEAEDIAANGAAVRSDSLFPSPRFTAWVSSILSRFLSKLSTKAQKEPPPLSDFTDANGEPLQISELNNDTSVLDAVVPDPWTVVFANNMRECILQGIQQLPDKYREVVIAHHIEERSYEAISSDFKLPIGTVRSRLARARKDLQKILRKSCPDVVFPDDIGEFADWLTQVLAGPTDSRSARAAHRPRPPDRFSALRKWASAVSVVRDFILNRCCDAGIPQPVSSRIANDFAEAIWKQRPEILERVAALWPYWRPPANINDRDLTGWKVEAENFGPAFKDPLRRICFKPAIGALQQYGFSQNSLTDEQWEALRSVFLEHFVCEEFAHGAPGLALLESELRARMKPTVSALLRGAPDSSVCAVIDRLVHSIHRFEGDVNSEEFGAWLRFELARLAPIHLSPFVLHRRRLARRRHAPSYRFRRRLLRRR
ncbi:MAG: RNA polymerase sigma factor [Fimbriimonadales bacterium]|nr:RNA polymerase sigma factor [Fimbriimonadales bacterium]